jgi:hypothetical protein
MILQKGGGRQQRDAVFGELITDRTKQGFGVPLFHSGEHHQGPQVWPQIE